MQYQEAVDYLYSRLPVFQNVGGRAFKPGLETTIALCEILGNPQDFFPIVHVGGTNGKGSSSHMLAAILQKAGYRVGLYTSPHLKSFTERIRVDGIAVSEGYVAKFVSDQITNIDNLSPSFFELTVALALKYFKDEAVDIAVVEVGMGGRLDSTNIVKPILSLITNVSLDHVQFLGDTRPKIAAEKAGIIKANTEVVISEYDPETAPVFNAYSEALSAPIVYADGLIETDDPEMLSDRLLVKVVKNDYDEELAGEFYLDLMGHYQAKNLGGVLVSSSILRQKGFTLTAAHIRDALGSVGEITGLKGRWHRLGSCPTTYCDTGHNYAGLSLALGQFISLPSSNKRLVIGFVSDKDIDGVLGLFPSDGVYYFCQPQNARALSAEALADKAYKRGLKGTVFADVNQALEAARRDSEPTDTIFVGGSTFVVADLIEL
ncbi:dihydrofolate synthase/folylpolyglutamate synthase [Dyadobacter jejuensis]|uniref:Dihydrofolate synthase/folylpolyglutamate synthase n=1 Tax=Dyadobacter jejuensis TaxID=1082580 RepID=A0A316AMI8_9BACT|nr:folylpolyglutamate synthase/dihydrofolate synthase family protein [Dyadobacter jejuensis]PWJ58953.1 dihydrofolate synthase/folylpolyglutamate synthase [Dyadobacter jejuensis]